MRPAQAVAHAVAPCAPTPFQRAELGRDWAALPLAHKRNTSTWRGQGLNSRPPRATLPLPHWSRPCSPVIRRGVAPLRPYIALLPPLSRVEPRGGGAPPPLTKTTKGDRELPHRRIPPVDTAPAKKAGLKA